MAHFDPIAKEVLAKVVYYGPPLAGKTTNLQAIYDSVPAEQKGPLFPLATATGQTIFFDLLPPGLGPVHGMRLRCELCTVDGPVSMQATLRAVLREADAVVFVADSQEAAMDHNLACLGSLEQVLLEERPGTPLVLQYNKRDLPTALPVQVLSELLNRRGVPAFQAIARQNVGVGEALRVVLRRLVNTLATLDPARASRPPVRRATARFAAAELAQAAAAPEGDKTRPVRHATQRSQARGSLTPDNRHLTIPAMPREEFLEAARRHDTVPASPREFFGRARDRHATLPAAPRGMFGRPEGGGVRAAPTGPVAPAPPAAQGDEETRPLRLSTAQSLAKESLDASRPKAGRTIAPAAGAADPEELAPPPEPARRADAEDRAGPAAGREARPGGPSPRRPKG